MICLAWASLLIGVCSITKLSVETVLARPILGSVKQSLGCGILTIEGNVDANAASRLNFEHLVERGIRRFDAGHVDDEAGIAIALRFFAAVDRALVEGDVIFPPTGAIDFLRDGLSQRVLADTEFVRAEAHFANARRLPWMRANQAAGGAFCFLDCDLASIVYVAVAEKLGLPVFMVELPGHTFVRWQSPGLTLNWDPNDGIAYPDDYYVQTWRVPSGEGIWPQYFENLSRARVLSTWWVLCGREKQSRGDFEGALSDFRAAVRMDPSDLGAVNELAWILSTCPRKDLRNGAEAIILARSNVAHLRRAVWLQTLAAAQAETGELNAAITTELEARHTKGSALGWVSPREIRWDTDATLAASRRLRISADTENTSAGPVDEN